MEAYILGTLYCNNRERKVRILDLSPSAKIRVIDANSDLVWNRVKTGALKIYGIKAARCLELTYFGKPLTKVLPIIAENTQGCYVALKLDLIDNKFVILCASKTGKLVNVPVENYIRNSIMQSKIFNIRLQESDRTNMLRFKLGDKFYEIYDKASGNPIQTTERCKGGLVNLGETSKTLDKQRFKWPTVAEYIEQMDKAHKRYILRTPGYVGSESCGKNSTIFEGVDPSEKVIVIPHGINYVESLVLDRQQYINDNKTIEIKKLYIPNTVQTFTIAATLTLSPDTELIFEDLEPKTGLTRDIRVLDYGPISQRCLSLNDKQIRQMVPKNLDYLMRFCPIFPDSDPRSKGYIVNLTDSEVEYLDRCGGSLRTDTGSLSLCWIEVPNDIKFISGSMIFDSEEPFKYNNDTLVFGPEITDITGSYEHIKGIRKLDFSQCKKLKKLDSCFNYLSDLEEIDLSGCEKLEDLNYCFMNNPKLKMIKFNNNLKRIGIYAFSDCETLDMSNITFPDKLVNIERLAFYGSVGDVNLGNLKLNMMFGFSELNTVYWDTKELNHNTIGFEVSKPTFEVPYCEEFGNRLFYDRNIEMMGKIHTKSKIRKLGSNCFADIDIKRCKSLDLWEHDEILVISEACFRGSHFEELALPKNTQVLGENCLKAFRSKYLLLPSSINKVEARAFYDTFISKCIYVVNNSFIHKYLKRKGMSSLVVCNSDEEAYQQFKREFNQASEREIMKAEFMKEINADPHMAELFAQPYINHINITLPIYKKLIQSPANPETDEPIKLNGKIISAPVALYDNYGTIDKLLTIIKNNKYNGSVLDIKDLVLTVDDFEGIPGTITTKSDKYIGDVYGNKGIYTEESTIDSAINMLSLLVLQGTTKLNPQDGLQIIDQLSRDEDGDIAALHMKVRGTRYCIMQLLLKLYRNASSIYLHAYIIIDEKEKQIKYIGVSNDDALVGGTPRDRMENSICNRTTRMYRDLWLQLSDFGKILSDDLFKVGDRYRTSSSGESMISGSIMPGIIDNEIGKLTKQLIFIGSKVERGSGKLFYFLNIFTGTVYKCTAIDPKTYSTILSFVNITVLEMCKITELDTKDLMGLLKYTLGSPVDPNKLKSYIFTDAKSIIKFTSQDGEAYDKLEGCKEFILSRYFENHEIDDFSTLNFSVLQKMLTTAYFNKSKKTYEKIIEQYRKPIATYEIDGHIITEFRNPKPRGQNIVGFYGIYSYVLDDLSGKIDKSKIFEVYTSNYGIYNVFRDIKSIYSEEAKSYGFLIRGNLIQSIDDFKPIIKGNSSCQYRRGDGGISYLVPSILINKKSGTVYLGAIDGGYREVILLLRYKTLEDAIRSNTHLGSTHRILADTHELFGAAEDIQAGDWDTMSILNNVIKAILDGYPNGYSGGDKFDRWFKLAAKQPQLPENDK